MIKIFIDFDGTITKKDVGDSIFTSFGGKQCFDFIDEYRKEKISAIECFNKECDACRGINIKELDEFIDSQEIDQTFIEFINYCNSQNFNYYILSDGMDYYIDRILKQNGIQHTKFFSNHLEIVFLDGTSKIMFKPSFPYTDENCDRCACCKRNHMLTLSADEDIIIYIGEGYSDRCPAHYADIVFAKDELLRYCQAKNISYFEYKDFSDITKRMKSLVENKQSRKNFGFRKKRQAVLAAREVFLGG